MPQLTTKPLDWFKPDPKQPRKLLAHSDDLALDLARLADDGCPHSPED